MTRTPVRGEIHLFEGTAGPILFDVLRGDFFEIDGVGRDVLEICEGREPEEVAKRLRGRHRPGAVRTALEQLAEAGILTSEPTQLVPFHPPSRIEVNHLTLCLTRDGAGSEDPSGHGTPRRRDPRRSGSDPRPPLLYMPEGIGLAALDLLLRESGALRDCAVTFEGGEPFLQTPLLRRLIAYGAGEARGMGKRLSFEVVTGGGLLTERVLEDLAERGVALTLEVRGEEGMKVAERVARLAAIQEDLDLRLQMVADRRHLDLRRRMEALLRLFPGARNLGIRWACLPRRHPDVLGAGDLPGVREELREAGRLTASHLLRGGATYLDEMEEPMIQLLSRRVLLYGCGTGSRSLAVSPEGDLAPCCDLVGRGHSPMGTVFAGIDADRCREGLERLHVERRDPCRGCWARYLCGGGCCGDSLLNTGDASVPNPISCERIRATYEEAMAVCTTVERRMPGLLAERYRGEHALTSEVRTFDEYPVLERYA